MFKRLNLLIAILVLLVSGCAPRSTDPAKATRCEQLIPIAVQSATRLIQSADELTKHDFEVLTDPAVAVLQAYESRRTAIESRAVELDCDNGALASTYREQVLRLSASTPGGEEALQAALLLTPFPQPMR